MKDDDKIWDIIVKEEFLGFERADGQSVDCMQASLVSFFKNNDLDVDNLQAQGYDGASSMSGMYNGFQAKITEIQPNVEPMFTALPTT